MSKFPYIKNNNVEKKEIDKAVLLLKIIASPSRLAILRLLLSVKDEICVNEIAEQIELSQSATSHQLAYLETRKIITSNRIGKTMCYEILDSPQTKKITNVINQLA